MALLLMMMAAMPSYPQKIYAAISESEKSKFQYHVMHESNMWKLPDGYFFNAQATSPIDYSSNSVYSLITNGLGKSTLVMKDDKIIKDLKALLPNWINNGGSINALKVIRDTIYLAGTGYCSSPGRKSESYAFYWRLANGSISTFCPTLSHKEPNSESHETAYAIAVKGEDVYLATCKTYGWKLGVPSRREIVVYKNGDILYTNDLYATDISITGIGVTDHCTYVTGSYFNKNERSRSIPLLLKNGIKCDITETGIYAFKGIAVANNAIYCVAQSSDGKAWIWSDNGLSKGLQLFDIKFHTKYSISSIYVDAHDTIYLGGNVTASGSNISKAIIWRSDGYPLWISQNDNKSSNVISFIIK